MRSARAELGVLSEEDCIRLLTNGGYGRLAFAHEGWPVILPVNFVFDDPDVVVRTGPGAKLESMPMTAVAFEIDEAAEDGTWGWSVLVQGPAFDITDATDEWSRRLRGLAVQPYVEGEHRHWLKIAAARVSGRWFGRHPTQPD